MAVALIQTLYDYHHAVGRRLWESIAHISDDQFVKDLEYSRGSIRNLMVHIASTDRRWLSGLEQQPDVGHLNPADYPTREVARQLWEEVATTMGAYIAHLDDAQLNAAPESLRGLKVWQALLHVANHGTDHRAQVLYMLHAFGAPTFEQDLLLHLTGG